MSFRDLNLASRPFENERPIERVTRAVWVVAGLLALLNAVLYWGAFSGLEGADEELEAIAAQRVAASEAVATAEERLRATDLYTQNLEATYLNQRLRERSFPWSRLFEDLAQVLPKGVRLYGLRPEAFARARRADPTDQHRVAMAFTGAAKSTEDLLALLDNVFAAEAFEAPFLPREQREPDGTIRFELSVTYLPGLAVTTGAPIALETEASAAGGLR